MRFTAEEVLETLIEVLLRNLEELKYFSDKKEEQFQYGEKTAYVECLEYIQLWEKAKQYGLDLDIEKDYPI